MAPILLQLFPRVVKYYTHHTSNSLSAGGIGGSVIGAIIIIILIIFVCAFIYEYKKAKRLYMQKGVPISKGKIFKKAALIALTFGLVGLLCACCLDSAGDVGNSGGGGDGGGVWNTQTCDAAPLMDQMGGGAVPTPMPTWQPQMDTATFQAPLNMAPALADPTV